MPQRRPYMYFPAEPPALPPLVEYVGGGGASASVWLLPNSMRSLGEPAQHMDYTALLTAAFIAVTPKAKKDFCNDWGD